MGKSSCFVCFAAAIGIVGVACSDYGGATLGTEPGLDGGGITAPGAGVGQPCSDTIACRAGLACTAGACQPGHSLGDGSPCTISDECTQGDYCGLSHMCAKAGAGADGSTCQTDGDCAPGLRCTIVGFGLQCKAEGSGDVGGACKTSSDCFAGLACANGKCTQTPPGVPPIGVATWPGVQCTDDPGPTTAYFRVPRGTGDGDFYRLPFPNDVRLKNGHPDLSNHPSPGAELLGFDAVDRYLRYVEQSTDGFSTYPTVYFRFSAGVNFDSLKTMGAMRWVDLTPGAPGGELGFGWGATTGQNHYICANSVQIRPPMGAPLLPGHTYGVILSTAIVDANKAAIKRSDDLTALLASVAPSDPSLAAAYASYKPLRDYITSKPLDASTILNAVVFTVAHATTTASKLAAAVAAVEKATPIAATNWVKCDTGVKSPCPQADGDRACAAADPAFDELHALVPLPIFQKGTEPYLTPTDGGDIATASDGTPEVQRTEQVCMALTVPKGTMPPGGWPLVVYAHGTGGSFRSVVTDGVAARLSAATAMGGAATPMAVLGIDQVEHGPRRGASTDSPNNLFFNFANPSAARGNPIQGAADQLSLLAFASKLNLTAMQSPTGQAIKIGALAYWGHSQGATEGGIAMPFATGVSGVVLSGEGASLIDALLNKTSPVNIKAALPFVLEEAPQDVNGGHPVLSILQNAIDPADPLNYAAPLTGPTTAPALKHVFQPFGLGDTFAPVPTEQTFAIAAGLGVAAPPSGVTPVDINGAMAIAAPAGSNVMVMGKPLTAIVREYQPNGFDGHFVSYKDATAISDVNNFLADVVAGKVPFVGR